jgi:hypothetical protein
MVAQEAWMSPALKEALVVWSDQAIYERIVESVLDHRLPPGTRLTEDRLCGIFGVSRTRIKPILVRLANERIITLTHNRVANSEFFAIDVHGFCTNDCRSTPTASDHCRVTHESATSSENALRHHHAVHIFWACVIAYQDDCFATIGCIGSFVGGEIDLAHCSTW